MNRKAVVLVLSLLTIGLGGVAFAQSPSEQLGPMEKLGGYSFFYQLSPIEKLGRHIFFDKNLSINRNQACAACHAPEVGWTGPDSPINATGAVYEGSVPGRFGNRKPPASAYAGASPILYQRAADGAWVGGMFWDGRATGWTLGDPLAEQAQGPFLNPLEQALPSAADVVARVCDSYYAYLFKWVWGSGACIGTVTLDYERIARSIAAYERSKEVNPFSSKYDWYLKGKGQLTSQEKSGLGLFEGKGKCANCHVSKLGPNGELPLFTDYTYDNLGIPKNPLNPYYYEPQWGGGPAWIDEGLGGFLRSIRNPNYGTELGKFKVPTLRNVDLRVRPHHMVAGEPVKAYGHNGYFKSLKEIVHFYNTRDVLPKCAQGSPGEKDTCWPEPELSTNMNTAEVGDLGLSEAEEDAIVAFLKTLSDGYMH